MSKTTREQNIRNIIEMEDRICLCQRCPELTKCVRKPSLGKGDLDPAILLVFETENHFNSNTNKIIELRNMIGKRFGATNIYHTFMVRCYPKSCSNLQNTNCFINSKLLDKDYNCSLSHGKCHGIPIKPNNEEIIACMPFLLEEIEILSPHYVIMFGRRVSEFLLRAYGIFDNIEIGKSYYHDDITLFSTVEENEFNRDDCRNLHLRVKGVSMP